MGKFLGDAASDVYGQTGPGDQIQSFIPRSSFNFYVDLTFRKPEAPSGLETIRLDRISAIQQGESLSRLPAGLPSNPTGQKAVRSVTC